MLKLIIPVVGVVMFVAGAAYGQGPPLSELPASNGTISAEVAIVDDTVVLTVVLTPGGASGGDPTGLEGGGTVTLEIDATVPPPADPPPIDVDVDPPS